MSRSPEAIALLAAGPICLDTTVPRHLARIGAGEPVLGPLRGRLHWPEAIPVELRRARAKVPNITATIAAGIEVTLTTAQSADAEDLRRETLTEAEIAVRRTVNRGEAECVVLCEARGWPLVVHDANGQSWADRRTVERYTVIDVLAMLAASGNLKPGRAWRIYERLCEPRGEADPDRAGMFAIPGWDHTSPTDRGRFMELVLAVASNLS